MPWTRVGHGLRGLVGALSLLGGVACGPAEVEPVSVLLPGYEPLPTTPAVEAEVDALLAQMSLAEKVAELHGNSILPVQGRWPVAGNDRLGIPPLLMADGPRGTTAIAGTSFPVGMARGALWNPELEGRVGEAIGLEAAAAGVNVLLAPVVNLTTHPRYGRAQETYGEDPWLVGRLGVAFVQGAQPHVIASVKHLAVNNIENTRFEVDARVPPDVLRETYLPQFEAVVREGNVGSVMSAYNKLNGSYCGENAELLTGILKEDWGFQGWVESDWLNGTHDAKASIEAGLDIEMPVDRVYDALEQLVNRGEIEERFVDAAARRTLRRKLEYDLANRSTPDTSVVRSEAHLALAREVARRGTVLLRNEGALPLEPGIATLAVVGRLAALENLGDTGSSDVPVEDAITVWEGMEAAFGASLLIHVDADTIGDEDRAGVEVADAVVVVVGLTDEDEGEYIPGKSEGDRVSMALSAEHEALIHEVAAMHDRVIVVLEGGSAITVEGWIDEVEAVVHAWYPGEQGGHAVAELLNGTYDFEGRLPIAVPTGPEQLPAFDNVSLEVDYPRYHGQRHLDEAGLSPRFPLGFGLSYTTFEHQDLMLTGPLVGAEEQVFATVRVRNIGSRPGNELVTLWLTPGDGSAPRRLVGFARLPLEAGAVAEVALPLDARSFSSWDEDARAWRLTEGEWLVEAGPHAGALGLSQSVVVELPAP